MIQVVPGRPVFENDSASSIQDEMKHSFILSKQFLRLALFNLFLKIMHAFRIQKIISWY